MTIPRLFPAAAVIVDFDELDVGAHSGGKRGKATHQAHRHRCHRYGLGCCAPRCDGGGGVSLGRSVTRCGRRDGERCGAVEDLNFQPARHLLRAPSAGEAVNIHPQPLISVNKYTQSRLGQLKVFNYLTAI